MGQQDLSGTTQNPVRFTRARMRRTVVLVGMMGAGKSAIGRSLAHRLNVDFIDSDDEIEKAANATIAEIFDRSGEPFFRDREAEVILRLLQGPPCVLSTGGGAFLAERNRDAISRHGVSLWLDADLDLLWDRVRQKDTRPLLRTPDPYGTLSGLYTARQSVYELADLRAKAQPEFSIEDMTETVLDSLSTRPDVLELL